MKIKVLGPLNYSSRQAVSRAASYRGPQPKTEVFSMCLIKYVGGAATVIPIPRNVYVLQTAPPLYPREAFGIAQFDYTGDSFSGLEISYTRTLKPPDEVDILLETVSLPALDAQWFYTPSFYKVHQPLLSEFPDSIPELFVTSQPWNLLGVGEGDFGTVNSAITTGAYMMGTSEILNDLDSYPAEDDLLASGWYYARFVPAHSGAMTSAFYQDLGGGDEGYIGATITPSDAAGLRAFAAGTARWYYFVTLLAGYGAAFALRYTPPYPDWVSAVDADSLIVVEDTDAKVAAYLAAFDAEFTSYMDATAGGEIADSLATGVIPPWWDEVGFSLPDANAPFSAMADTHDFTTFEVVVFSPTAVYGKAVFAYDSLGIASFVRWVAPVTSAAALVPGEFNILTVYSGLQYPDTGGFDPREALVTEVLAAFTPLASS